MDSRNLGLSMVAAVLLGTFAVISVAEEGFYYVDDSGGWPVAGHKDDTVVINGMEFPVDQVPDGLITKIGNAMNGTGIRVYKNGGSVADMDHGFFDAGVESVSYNGVIGASNATYGAGVYGTTELSGYGVVGLAWSNASGVGTGVLGRSDNHAGYGVHAINGSPEDNEVSPDGSKGTALYAMGATDIYYEGSGLLQEDVREHVAVIENRGTYDVGILALYASDRRSNDLRSFDNFITFIARSSDDTEDEAVGAIEGAAGGITLDTTSGDFAEWLARRDPAESIEPGDIVGVSNGLVSREITPSAQLQVVSTAPAVSGNSPKTEQWRYERVAFIGQVPARVRGIVKAGDYILPSGNNDGTGIARSADQLTAVELGMIVGRAWESSDAAGVKRVNVAVGLETHAELEYIRRQDERIADLERQLSEKSAQLEQLAVRFDQLDRHLAALAAAKTLAVRE